MAPRGLQNLQHLIHFCVRFLIFQKLKEVYTVWIVLRRKNIIINTLTPISASCGNQEIFPGSGVEVGGGGTVSKGWFCLPCVLGLDVWVLLSIFLFFVFTLWNKEIWMFLYGIQTDILTPLDTRMSSSIGFGKYNVYNRCVCGLFFGRGIGGKFCTKFCTKLNHIQSVLPLLCFVAGVFYDKQFIVVKICLNRNRLASICFTSRRS